MNNLAFHFQPDQEKEQGHQAIVDPQQQWLGDSEVAHVHFDGQIEKCVVLRRERRIGRQQCCGCCGKQHEAGRGLASDEFRNDATWVVWKQGNGSCSGLPVYRFAVCQVYPEVTETTPAR